MSRVLTAPKSPTQSLVDDPWIWWRCGRGGDDRRTVHGLQVIVRDHRATVRLKTQFNERLRKAKARLAGVFISVTTIQNIFLSKSSSVEFSAGELWTQVLPSTERNFGSAKRPFEATLLEMKSKVETITRCKMFQYPSEHPRFEHRIHPTHPCKSPSDELAVQFPFRHVASAAAET